MNRILLYIAACLLTLTACKKETQLIDKDKYIYEIPQVNLTENANVGAYYYQYKAADWAKALAENPSLGKYDPLAPAVMTQQISWAAQGGVDFFVFKWNGATNNDILNAFKARGNNPVKMVIEFNTAHLNATNASPLTGAKLQTMLNEWKTLTDDYLKQDFYYKADNRPVILLTPLNLAASALTSIDYKRVTDTLRTEMKKWGVEPYIIGQLTTGWVAPVNYDMPVMAAMDGIVLNNWSTNDFDRAWGFFSYADLNYQNWKKGLGDAGVDYVPCIFPGFNTPSDSKPYVIERSAKNYVSYCNIAKRTMGKKRLVLINSWNDFQKGTTIEPATEYNQDYLNITKREFKVK